MTALDQDLQEIAGETVRMLSLVREECDLARMALIDGDVAAGERCVAADLRIDELQEGLERRILTVIARRQPAARDLRFLGAMYRALADIERAGDYAVHVAKSAILLAGKPPVKKYLDMGRILQVLIAMLEVTSKALAESDAGAARRALAMDNEIDDLYEQIQRELLSFMIADASRIGPGIELLAVGRYLERLGDHIENVNEHLIFWLTNERL
ncbi:MAG TPA: phosphate signaling complex protein PhoU [Trueperaceae bacterium]